MTPPAHRAPRRVSRATSESTIELDARPRRHRRSRHRHDGAVLRPPAHRVREALAHRPHRAGDGRHRDRRAPHGRGHRRSCSARRSARRSATRPGISPLRRRARAARRGARAGRRRHLAAAPTSCTPASRPASSTTSSAATSPVRWCATSSRRSRSTRRSPCTSRVLAGRDPHHIAEAEFKAFARAFRQAKALDPLVDGHPVDEGRAVSRDSAGRRRARLRLGQRALGGEGARARPAPTSS